MMNKEELANNYVSKIMTDLQGQEISKDQMMIILKQCFLDAWDACDGE